MEITKPERYQHWWHSASNEIGLANALALQTVKTITTPAHKNDIGFDLIVCADAATTLCPQAMAACLTESGVGVDCDWLVLGQEQTDWLRNRQRRENSRLGLAATGAAFHSLQHYYGVSPWMTGYRGFFLSTKDAHSYAEPSLEYTGNHYNAAVHRAAFALPTWWQRLLA